MAPCREADLESGNDNDSRQATNVACRVFLWLENGVFFLFSQFDEPRLMLHVREKPWIYTSLLACPEESHSWLQKKQMFFPRFPDKRSSAN